MSKYKQQRERNEPDIADHRNNNVHSAKQASRSGPASGFHNSPRIALQRKSIEGRFGSAIQLADESRNTVNNTGLPDKLKSGVESLSGISLDSVKVHYNSPQPAQLNAAAFAQGTNIHVGPGQERHLPHEAWHVVQQAQGRVIPTKQFVVGVAINDDKGLEAEADRMGEKALRHGSERTTITPLATIGDIDRPAQRAIGLEKETNVGLLKQGPGSVNPPADLYTTIADQDTFRIDTDKDPNDSRAILEIVVKHFDETTGSEDVAFGEMENRIIAAWNWVETVEKLPENTPLKGKVPDLLPGYENLIRGKGKGMKGVIHFTVGISMSSVPALFQFLAQNETDLPTNRLSKQRVRDALLIGDQFIQTLLKELKDPDKMGTLGDINKPVEKELRGYVSYFANQVLTANDSYLLDVKKISDAPLAKNLFSILGRVPLSVIHNSLSEPSKKYLSTWTVDAMLKLLQSGYTDIVYGSGLPETKWGDATVLPLIRKLVESGLHGMAAISPRAYAGKMTVVDTTDVRATGDVAAAAELRKIASGLIGADLKNHTRQGLINKAKIIIAQSRRSWE